MKKRIKKAFTLVELLVVIAILAVLSTVAVVGYNSFTEKANLSADQQAVTQMNRLLAAADVNDDFDDIFDVVAFFDDENLEIDDYKPLTKNTYFYWLKNDNIIVHVGKDGNIIYPADVTISEDSELISLSGMAPVSDDYTVAEDGTVTIDDGAKLTHLIDAVKNNEVEVTTITLSGDVDLKGAAVDFGVTTTDITIKGENGASLKGIRVDDNALTPTSGEYAGHSYGFGLFGNIKKGVVTIENITISNLFVGNSIGTHDDGANTAGLIAGYVTDGAKLVMNNVTIENCTVTGYQKVGGLFGQLQGTVELNNVDFVNTTVSAYVEGAKIAGVVTNNGDLTVDSNCDFSGITVVGLMENQLKTSDFSIAGGVVLPGDSGNTFFIRDYSNLTYLQGVATNDWAWYHLREVNSEWGTASNRPKATVAGVELDYLNGDTASASANFVDGAPVNN